MLYIHSRRRIGGWAFAVAALLIVPLASAVRAQDFTPEPVIPTSSNYGGVGLLDMRNARFMPDGDLSLNVDVKQPDDRVALTFQALPWLEATFRYTINYALPPVGQRALYDRSFDLKFRLSREDEYLPQVAVGFQDILGTGVYSAEYLVASKEWGPLDFTLGMGWGRLSTRAAFPNPLRLISSKFGIRPGDNSPTGGTPLITSLFRGPDVGLFGGIEYQTPIPKLTFKLEYSSDAYKRETQRSGINYGAFPLDAGLTYRFWSDVDLDLAFMQGREISANITIILDPTKPAWPFRIDPPPPFKARSEEELQAVTAALTQDGHDDDVPWRVHFVDLTAPNGASDSRPADPTLKGPIAKSEMAPQAGPILTKSEPSPVEIIAKMRGAIEAQRLDVESIEIAGNIVKVEISNTHYLRDAEAIARVLRVLSDVAPARIMAFQVSTSIYGMPLTTVTVPRAQTDALARHSSTPAELWTSAVFADAKPDLAHVNGRDYPTFSWSLYPAVQEDLFDPNNPTYLGFGVGGSTHVDLLRGFTFDAQATWSIWNDFDSITRTSNSVLPHVRSDIAQYLKHGATGIDDLTMSYYSKLAPDLYGRVTAGYIESMFAGVGGEVLYRPIGSRFAVGADLFQVYQRDFDRLFGVQHYNVATGHVSVYYETPFYDITAVVRGGRYLAGDYGATFELYRRFDTGILVGGWFTLTNVSSARFGEGSFDKGIRIVIPLEWGVPFGTPTKYEFDLRPIQRDGGQPLNNDAILYDMTQTSSAGDLSRQWSDVFK